MNCFDNNDTVSNSFIWFHSKNETIKREVKLSFGTETMLISLSNWNLIYCYSKVEAQTVISASYIPWAIIKDKVEQFLTLSLLKHKITPMQAVITI